LASSGKRRAAIKERKGKKRLASCRVEQLCKLSLYNGLKY
jgi:hypothetical protein